MPTVDKNAALIALSESLHMNDEPFAVQSLPRRVFTAIWSLESEVNNGGFAQYFVNSSSQSASFVITALEAIGAHNMADICRCALKKAFPEGLPDTPKKIAESVKSRYDVLEEELEPFSHEFYSYPDDLTELLFEFVVNHPEEFGDVTANETGG